MPKCDFNKVALHGCFPVNLLHIFRTPFSMNTFGWLLLKVDGFRKNIAASQKVSETAKLTIRSCTEDHLNFWFRVALR